MQKTQNNLMQQQMPCWQGPSHRSNGWARRASLAGGIGRETVRLLPTLEAGELAIEDRLVERGHLRGCRFIVRAEETDGRPHVTDDDRSVARDIERGEQSLLVRGVRPSG